MDQLELWCASSRARLPGSISGPAIGSIVDRFRLQQREPEVRHAPQEPLELGLVAHVARQHSVALASREPHAMERGLEVVAELSLDDKSVVSVRHVSEGCTFDRALVRSAGLSPG
jgi:hypothetical protein